MISLCMMCNVVDKVELSRPPLTLSHGLCIDCMPKYLRQSEMTEEEIENFMKEYKGRTEDDDNGRD